ncbi:MAG: YggS family pyridoxal phosphate-dependent enzyme [Candidatus Aminicenantes bacterium]|nr:YggS family pyridoxal phosphate-dependent enzyme [Candidatus Aminicenantes bacterium]
MGTITENVRAVLAGLPPGVELVAAAKTRSPAEILEAIEAGVGIIGENYVKEAQEAFAAVGHKARWHYIGHLQSNKVKKAVEIFDMIETVDSVDIARDIGRRAAAAGKTMPVLIEINSGEEDQKAGVRPAEAEALVRAVAEIPNIALQGLMTMGPFEGEPDDFRPYFKTTREIFESVKTLGLPGVEMKHLSMGMSHSYKVAIEEGANLIRLGTFIFGTRVCLTAR